MPSTNPNTLLVEGDDEKRVIPYFMDKHVEWGDKDKEKGWVVYVKAFDGVDHLLEPGVIEAESKVPGLRAIGILVDADDHFDSRWSRVKDRCRKVAASFPEDLPPGGLIHVTSSGLRIGVWVMPDNRSRGMLETFLGHLLISDRLPLWEFARECCAQSKGHGASYTDAHHDKANIHTYLAWIEPPGLQLHGAVFRGALEARSPLGEQFARWFIDLFQLTPRAAPGPG